MIIETHTGTLTLQVSEIIPEDRPDMGSMRLEVDVQTQGFTARNNRVWIWPVAFERFLAQLTELELARMGRASLESMSPGELILTIRAVDRRGHMVMEGQVGRTIYIQDSAFALGCQFAFELDPGLLPELLKAFKALPVTAS